MEAKDENDRMAIVSAPNSNTKVRITNEDLVELGFPDFLVDPSLDRKLRENEIYLLFREGTSRANAELNFYNALYILAKLYQKHTGKPMIVSHSGFDVYLNDEEVFRSYLLLKKQNLNTIRNMIKELLTTKYNNDFEALEKEFAQMYAEEKAKVEHDDVKEIFNRDLADKLTQDKKVKYLNIVELLEKEEFSEKKLYLYDKGWFGESYYLKPTMLMLRDALKRGLERIWLSQNQNILFLRTEYGADYYAIKLKENEKQEILDLLNSLGVQL